MPIAIIAFVRVGAEQPGDHDREHEPGEGEEDVDDAHQDGSTIPPR